MMQMIFGFTCCELSIAACPSKKSLSSPAGMTSVRHHRKNASKCNHSARKWSIALLHPNKAIRKHAFMWAVPQIFVGM
jgi:hypothetical protein